MQKCVKFSASSVIHFIKNGLTVDKVFLFNAIGIPFNCPQVMLHYHCADISIEQIISFIASGYSPTSSAIIIKFIENGICADEVSSFRYIEIKQFTEIVKYKMLKFQKAMLDAEIGYFLIVFHKEKKEDIANGVVFQETTEEEKAKIDDFLNSLHK